jgi:hypothetical protein
MQEWRIMEINLDHRNLNLFHHFGDRDENENNTTRAFLIAATRSPWSPMLFRSFLDLLAEQILGSSPELLPDFDKFFRSWPETLQVSLERDISADKFPGDDVAVAILVALTPVSECGGQIVDFQFSKPTGRVDATLIARRTEGDTSGGQSKGSALAIIIESKLYGPAGIEQLARYKSKLEEKKIRTVLVEVRWEDIYKLCESLPQAAEHDPVLSDFKEFLARDARLVGFTGFREEDFVLGPQLLDSKLQRLCDRIVGKGDDPVLGGGRAERKRGGLDYDLPLTQQSSLIGNIGLASWSQDALHAKLVIGWRSRWHTDRVLDTTWNAECVPDLIRQVGRGTLFLIDAQVRPYFNRFEYDSAALWSTAIDGADAARVWQDAVEFARSFHAKRLNEENVVVLRRSPSKITNESAITRAVAEGVNCFVPLVLVASWRSRDLATMKPEEQLRMIREKLLEMATLLKRLSGVSA